jgi:MoaA/NifB/PqqE/SkfB family radical SAM enzyme
MLVIDSIARTSRPIVVLTGEMILEKYGRLEDVLEYGYALGLKMIVEVTPAELTGDLLARFSRFGERIFRVKISDAIRENVENRIESAPFYDELDGCLDRLEKSGYEIHLVYTATGPDTRILALVHDYAVRRSARGIYCHLRFDLGNGGTPKESGDVDEFIRRFATMKEYSPAEMIISPQCVRFVHTSTFSAREVRGKWEYACLAGRSFAFIDETGRVRLCGGNADRGISLRDTGYDFRKIWLHAPAFAGSRTTCGGCEHGDHSDDSDHPAGTGQVPPNG